MPPAIVFPRLLHDISRRVLQVITVTSSVIAVVVVLQLHVVAVHAASTNHGSTDDSLWLRSGDCRTSWNLTAGACLCDGAGSEGNPFWTGVLCTGLDLGREELQEKGTYANSSQQRKYLHLNTNSNSNRVRGSPPSPLWGSLSDLPFVASGFTLSWFIGLLSKNCVDFDGLLESVSHWLHAICTSGGQGATCPIPSPSRALGSGIVVGIALALYKTLRSKASTNSDNKRLRHDLLGHVCSLLLLRPQR